VPTIAFSSTAGSARGDGRRPFANGFLSGKYKADTTYTGLDARRVIMWFSKENVLANQPLLDVLTDFAHQKGATPAQIALA
jgi:aryl-alcohol dehydrogenase-like predicted oxidoreductase